MKLYLFNTFLIIFTIIETIGLSKTSLAKESILENNTDMVQVEILPEKESSDANNSTDEFFAKIQNEVVPIETGTFSAKKTILKKNTNPDYYPEIENIYPCPNTTYSIFTPLCNLTSTADSQLSLKKHTIFEINKTKLREYLESLNENIKKDPQNVKLKAEPDGKIIVTKKEVYGYELDIDKIIANSLLYFGDLPTKKIVTPPLKLTTPTLTSENYQKLGIKQKIGHGESNFKGSPKNRIHNINNATSKFEGVIIAPQETFSFIENLGPVDASTGYKEELVIKNNKTIPEFGGGVCQVSTTLFRSAVQTGLEITERRNHAYPVQYYAPQGTDATVYIPKPDLQFINNTPGYILLQPHIEGTVLSFDIFGTSDGRQVETEGPTLLKRTDDGGRKYVWWQIIKDKDGNQIAKNGFWSFYQNAAKFHSNHTEQLLPGKPKGWSTKEWRKYKREHGIP